MCGRFAMHTDLSTLKRLFDIRHAAAEVIQSYNIPPSQRIAVVIKKEKRLLEKFYWGLVPFWANDKSIGSKMINARKEGLASKNAFKAAFKRKRCLIPANGFFEWKKENGKQPWYFHLLEAKTFAFAGLWDEWKGGGEDEPYRSCTIITTDSSKGVSDIHHRMPAVLKPEKYDEWLDPENQDMDRLESILEKHLVVDFQRYPVSRKVNSPKNDNPECIVPVDDDTKR